MGAAPEYSRNKTATPAAPKPAWRDAMQRLSDSSVAEYRRIVHDNSAFTDYFHQATPANELQRLSIGSRPAKRRVSGGIDSLRAIPWVFAWTQMRLMLPAWLGTSKALSEQWQQCPDTLRAMHRDWPFFHMLLDMQQMVLSKTEPHVARYYQQRLLLDESLETLGDDIFSGLPQAVQTVADITGHTLLDNAPALRHSVDVRNPYIYPLHVIQVELMRRLRDVDAGQAPLLERALMVSIAGIAAGLRNTG